jgi:phytoene/squalene synthetase
MVEVSPEVVRNRIATLYAVVEDLQTAKDRMDDARRAQLGSWSQLPTVHRAQEPVYSTLLDLTSRLSTRSTRSSRGSSRTPAVRPASVRDR